MYNVANIKQLTASSSNFDYSHLHILTLLLFIFVHFVSDMFHNKHKVAFYFVLVILVATLRHCHSSKPTEIISHSSRELPKNANEIAPAVDEMRQIRVDKSVSAKLLQIRNLLKSLVFDWSLGESEIQGEVDRRNYHAHSNNNKCFKK